ncbi:hypothetical protein FH972_004453 [Carpinus fangiana]|uniref:Uncharacterized protein n=1 Tax=Carpinus fangiana TaxID=176857 RepID=A0A5N6QLU9_9ROSI|nr:hypothetical protein FH972_004453 [Carpinus fangiana]
MPSLIIRSTGFENPTPPNPPHGQSRPHHRPRLAGQIRQPPTPRPIPPSSQLLIAQQAAHPRYPA